ncbi:osteopontin [Phasianus colchicus]|uniref:Secreted phosphoprotein 1 n=1 Tax=Phasianus colchicus TaxID=9054 RepID=A0A669QAR2_PHACC|nr:osteopontin [Phasianus colchicus]XP_031452464.1 osteopontin [Phasianus colchicus]
MKLALLCLCFISIAAAWPVSKSKQHAISASSEEKYDPRSHHTHRYYQDHVDSQSQEHLQQTQNDLASLQQTHYSSEENADVPEQPDFPDFPSKSQEAVDDTDDDDNDSNDTDESDEVVTDFPTEAPVTPFNRGDNAGRGDSVAYGFRAKAHVVKASKLRKTARKLIEDDATAEVGGSQLAGLWWPKESREQDSRELAQHQSAENDSRPRFDSPEVDGGDSKASAGVDSRESQGSVPAVDASNQTLESAEDAEDRHSIENNEVTR